MSDVKKSQFQFEMEIKGHKTTVSLWAYHTAIFFLNDRTYFAFVFGIQLYEKWVNNLNYS